jgi:hypothetical protein
MENPKQEMENPCFEESRATRKSCTRAYETKQESKIVTGIW